MENQIVVLCRTCFRHAERLERTTGTDDILVAAGGVSTLDRASVSVLRARQTPAKGRELDHDILHAVEVRKLPRRTGKDRCGIGPYCDELPRSSEATG